MHTEGNDPGRPEGTSPHPTTVRDSEHPGYEVQDVSVRGIVTFLAGLAGFVIIFFFFCFLMGRVINSGLVGGGAASMPGWTAPSSRAQRGLMDSARGGSQETGNKG